MALVLNFGLLESLCTRRPTHMEYIYLLATLIETPVHLLINKIFQLAQTLLTGSNLKTTVLS